MAGLVSGNHSSEALGCGLHGSVNEREFGDVVLVDHTKDGLLLADVHFRLLNFLLIGGLELPKAIVTDKVSCLLFRLAIDSSKRLRKSTGVEIVDSWLSFALDFQIGLLLVSLLEVETLLVPVLIKSLI